MESKVKKSLTKRIKITSSGKWIYKHAHTAHLSGSKTNKQLQRLKKTTLVSHSDYKRLKHLV